MGATFQVLTGKAAAGLAVIRVMGPDSLALLAATDAASAKVGTHRHVTLRDKGQPVDDVVVARLAEETWEICCHGGLAVVEQVVRLLTERGATEVSAAEPVHRLLPLARTELAVRRVLAGNARVWLLDPPVVVMVGLPNAGKSSLLNALAGGERRAIVSAEAGTTRDAVEAEVDCCGLIVRLIDAPGLRESADAIEQAAIGLAMGRIQQANLLLHVRDGTAATGPAAVARVLEGRAHINVSTRADLGKAGQGLHVSSVTGEGLDGLRAGIFRHFIPD